MNVLRRAAALSYTLATLTLVGLSAAQQSAGTC